MEIKLVYFKFIRTALSLKINSVVRVNKRETVVEYMHFTCVPELWIMRLFCLVFFFNSEYCKNMAVPNKLYGVIKTGFKKPMLHVNACYLPTWEVEKGEIPIIASTNHSNARMLIEPDMGFLVFLFLFLIFCIIG